MTDDLVAPPIDDWQVELAQLRRRAYGRDADIASDPAAVSRLHDLEARGRMTEREDGDSATPVAAEAVAPGLATGGGTPSPAPPAAERRRRRRRISPWLSIGVVAVVATMVGFTIPAALTPAGDVTLRPIDSPDVNAATALMARSLDLDLGSPVVYESYDDLQVLSAANDAGMTCLLVSWADHWSDFSCTPAGLTPVVDYDAYLGAPILLDDPLPPGTVIRFELRGDAVHVTLQEPPEGRLAA